MGLGDGFIVYEDKKNIPEKELEEKGYCFAPGIGRWARNP